MAENVNLLKSLVQTVGKRTLCLSNHEVIDQFFAEIVLNLREDKVCTPEENSPLEKRPERADVSLVRNGKRVHDTLHSLAFLWIFLGCSV